MHRLFYRSKRRHIQFIQFITYFGVFTVKLLYVCVSFRLLVHAKTDCDTSQKWFGLIGNIPAHAYHLYCLQHCKATSNTHVLFLAHLHRCHTIKATSLMLMIWTTNIRIPIPKVTAKSVTKNFYPIIMRKHRQTLQQLRFTDIWKLTVGQTESSKHGCSRQDIQSYCGSKISLKERTFWR